MQVLENRSDLSAVELSLFGVEVTDSSVVGKKITTGEELSSEVNVAVVLEEAIIVESERVVNSLKDEFLVLDVIDVLAVDDLGLLHGLDSKLLAGLAFQPANLNITEGTFSETVYETKVFGLLAVETAFSLGSHSLNCVSLTLFYHIKFASA